MSGSRNGSTRDLVWNAIQSLALFVRTIHTQRGPCVSVNSAIESGTVCQVGTIVTAPSAILYDILMVIVLF